MNVTREVILAVVEIFGVFGVGFVARHLGYINEKDIERWGAFIVDMLFPLLIFHAVIAGFEPGKLGELWPLPVIGIGMMALGALIGYPARLLLRSREPEVRRTFHHFCAMNNFGFLPIIICYNLWGDTGLANLFLFNLGSQIGYWTIGTMLLGQSELRGALKAAFTPPTVALFVALFFCFTGAREMLPEVVQRIAKNAGSAAIPAQLCVIGATLYPLPKILHRQDLALLTLMRLVLIPAALCWIVLALPLSLDVTRVSLVVALMPVAVGTVILARRYGGCSDFAAQAAVVTTVVSMVTIPVGMWLLRDHLQPSAMEEVLGRVLRIGVQHLP